MLEGLRLINDVLGLVMYLFVVFLLAKLFIGGVK